MLNVEGILKTGGSRGAVQAISQCLFELEVQMHIIHLQAINRSLETHLALGSFYESLGGLNDDLVEKSFAKVGLMDNYKDIKIKNNFNPLELIQQEMTKIEAERAKIKEGYIQQIVDNILEQFAHVIYKLKNLQ